MNTCTCVWFYWCVYNQIQDQLPHNVHQDGNDLIFTNITPGDTGAYMCLATNNYGSQFQLVDVIVQPGMTYWYLLSISVLKNLCYSIVCVVFYHISSHLLTCSRFKPISNMD